MPYIDTRAWIELDDLIDEFDRDDILKALGMGKGGVPDKEYQCASCRTVVFIGFHLSTDTLKPLACPICREEIG